MIAKRLRSWTAPLAVAAVTATLALVDLPHAHAQRSFEEAIFGRPVGFQPAHEARVRSTTNRHASYSQEPATIEEVPAPRRRGGPVREVASEEIIYEDGPYEDGYEGDCADCSGNCPPSVRRMFWARGEYLYWWTKGMDVPPLVTTSTAAGTGALGATGTNVAFGGDLINNDGRSGAKFTLGWELFTSTPSSIEVSYFGLGKEETNFSLDTPAGVTVGRPFFNINPATGIARQDAVIVSQPNNFSGAVHVDTTTELNGGEALMRWTMCEATCSNTEMMLGYRFLRLDDSIHVRQDTRALSTAGGLVVGTTINLFDLLESENEFHGFEFGTSSKYYRGRWTLETLVKLAIGDTRSTTTISGNTTTTVPGAGSANSNGGLLSQDSNTGTHTYDSFSVVPELGVSLKYDLTPCLQASVGYSFLYWSKVGRAGEQIDTDVNLTQQPPGPTTGDLRPVAIEAANDFWAQGLNVGLEWTF
ncbi:MAG: BBP7 family outer membrane beta-barrel protein [Pirellulales bacterium]